MIRILTFAKYTSRMTCTVCEQHKTIKRAQLVLYIYNDMYRYVLTFCNFSLLPSVDNQIFKDQAGIKRNYNNEFSRELKAVFKIKLWLLWKLCLSSWWLKDISGNCLQTLRMHSDPNLSPSSFRDSISVTLSPPKIHRSLWVQRLRIREPMQIWDIN